MNEESLINKLEYCSIKRAAQLLHCEIEDIEHFVSIGAIGAYVLLFGYDAELEVELGPKLQFKDPDKFVKDIGVIISTEMSYASVKAMKGEHPSVRVQARLEGLWRVIDITTVFELMHDRETTDAKLLVADRDCEDEFEIENIFRRQKDDEAYVRGFTAPKISKDDVLIIGGDLRRLFKSLKNNEELPNTHSDVGFKTRKKSILDKNIKITKTGDNARLRALGMMAYLFSQRFPGYQHGCRLNASKLSELIDKEMSLIGVEKLTGEIRKDISAGYKLISKELPEKS